MVTAEIIPHPKYPNVFMENTPIAKWAASVNFRNISDVEALCLHCLVAKADSQTGRVNLSVAAIHKQIRSSLPAGSFHDKRKIVADAVDSLTAKGIIETVTPGVPAEPGKPGVAAKRRIVL